MRCLRKATRLGQVSELANAAGEYGKREPPACPKPCRPGPTAPEFLCPLNCKHSHSSHHGSSEVLDMITEKNDAGREPISTGCPPSCYCGSPPRRLDNPLVHDVRFVHQAEVLSPWARAKLSDGLGFTSTPI